MTAFWYCNSSRFAMQKSLSCRVKPMLLERKTIGIIKY